MNTRTRITSLAISFLAWPFIAWAVDGQIDIATLPFTISEPGSYVVVADLRMGTPDVSGIVILGTNDVTLDLNGHTLAGAGQDAGTYGSGIFVSGYAENIVIRNGTIREFPMSTLKLRLPTGTVLEERVTRQAHGATPRQAHGAGVRRERPLS